MPINFAPRFTISSKMVNCLLQIESVKEKVVHLSITSAMLASLRNTARLKTTHYSTMIEGNRLDQAQVKKVLKHDGHFPGRARDEQEVKGYYAALQQVEQWVLKKTPAITEKMIQTLHALVMSGGRTRIKPSHYRDGQNVIIDSGDSGRLVYMPPEAKDVLPLMKSLLQWLTTSTELPCPVRAAIAHYQFATIHPYYDGNGRTARLLTTLLLHLGGYDLRGLYSLEEYYARDLSAYYSALSVGPSHNYYLGRADADITKWLEYFIAGMNTSFERVLASMREATMSGQADQTNLIRALDPKQRKALEIFQEFEVVTARQIGDLFGFGPRSRSQLCQRWLVSGFLEIVDFSNKGRKYRLGKPYQACLSRTLF